MQQNVIEIENLSFSYSEDRNLLKNINIKIAKGKVTAIMGGSGSGKTTILRLISGQIKAQHGNISVFGENLTGLSSNQIHNVRKRLGLLFQFGALFTDINVAANVAFPLQEHTNLSKDFINKIVAMKLEAVGLTGTQDLMPNQLSGGMARRVALARAIALDPELMLYDEPFTGLDPISLNTTAMLIKKLNSSLNQTAVLVTHDIAATMGIADYMYFMANGEIIAEGTPEQIKSTTNPAVKQFINGEISGPFEYKYSTPTSYQQYLGQQ